MIDINDAETDLNSVFPDVGLIEDNTIQIGEIDVDMVRKREKELKQKEQDECKVMEMEFEEKKTQIKTISKKTDKKLESKKDLLVKILKQKEAKNLREFKKKAAVLRKDFKRVVQKLIRHIRIQKANIVQNYGPIILADKRSEPPIFELDDRESARQLAEHMHTKNRMPHPTIVKIMNARCLKDKVGAGQFIVMVHYLDRIGGSRVQYNLEECRSKFVKMSKLIRRFKQKKRKFINAEQRVMQVEAEGKSFLINAPRTGMNFFNPAQAQEVSHVNLDSDESEDEDIEESEASS